MLFPHKNLQTPNNEKGIVWLTDLFPRLLTVLLMVEVLGLDKRGKPFEERGQRKGERKGKHWLAGQPFQQRGQRKRESIDWLVSQSGCQSLPWQWDQTNATCDSSADCGKSLFIHKPFHFGCEWWELASLKLPVLVSWGTHSHWFCHRALQSYLMQGLASLTRVEMARLMLKELLCWQSGTKMCPSQRKTGQLSDLVWRLSSLLTLTSSFCGCVFSLVLQIVTTRVRARTHTCTHTHSNA